MTTKAAFKKELHGKIDSILAEMGYQFSKERASSIKANDECEVRFAYEITTVGYPKSIVSLDALVFIDVQKINEIGARLFLPMDVNPATLWGNFRIFTPANSTMDTSYYFDFDKDHESQLERFFKDLRNFDKFASSLKSVSALSNEQLAKAPLIRKNFGSGLGWDYKYGYPQYMSIIHALNGEFDDAQDCAEHAGHLNADEKRALFSFVAEQRELRHGR